MEKEDQQKDKTRKIVTGRRRRSLFKRTLAASKVRRSRRRGVGAEEEGGTFLKERAGRAGGRSLS